MQSKSYFEVKIQQTGSWSVGLATRQTDLSKKIGGMDKESWCLCSDNSTRNNDEEFRPAMVTTQQPIANRSSFPSGLIGIEDDPDDILLNESDLTVNGSTSVISKSTNDEKKLFPGDGDTIGVSYDHIELNFYCNGKNVDVPFRNVKGTVYPVVYGNS